MRRQLRLQCKIQQACQDKAPEVHVFQRLPLIIVERVRKREGRVDLERKGSEEKRDMMKEKRNYNSREAKEKESREREAIREEERRSKAAQPKQSAE